MLPAVANVAEVTAPDAGTVLIKFKKVSPEVFDLLQAMSIIDPSAMDGIARRAAGAGRSSLWSGSPGIGSSRERNADLLEQARPVRRSPDLQGLRGLRRDGGRPPVRDHRPVHRRATQGRRPTRPRLQHGPGIPGGTDLRAPHQRHEAPLRPEGGPAGPALRHRPEGHRREGSVRRERADGAPLQPALQCLRPVGHERSTPSISTARRSSCRSPASTSGKAEAHAPSAPRSSAAIAQILRPISSRSASTLVHRGPRPDPGVAGVSSPETSNLHPSFSGNTQKYPTRVTLNSICAWPRIPCGGTTCRRRTWTRSPRRTAPSIRPSRRWPSRSSTRRSSTKPG